MDVPTAAVILAVSDGKDFNSKTDQYLHKVAGTPLICHAIGMVRSRAWGPLVIVTGASNADAVKEAARATGQNEKIRFVESAANDLIDIVDAGVNALGAFEGNVMVLPANMPLLQPDTTLLCLEAMIAEGNGPTQAPYAGLSRRGLSQYFPVFCAEKSWLQQALQIAQGITPASLENQTIFKDLSEALVSHKSEARRDFLSHFAAAGFALCGASEDDLCVVSSQAELTVAEKVLKARLIAKHQAAGVAFRDPDGTFIDAEVAIGRDTVIGVGVQLYGRTLIAENVRIEGPTTITDSVLEEGVFVRSFTVLEGAHISQNSGAGPFARLREGTVIGPSSYVGNFVETKNASLGRNTLACHLTYLGDTQVGDRTNIGAGTITCNFNGVAKNSTKIGDNAFVGSNSTLVAPLSIGSNALIAAGSTITQSVPEGGVSFGRARQSVKENYAQTLRDSIRDKESKK